MDMQSLQNNGCIFLIDTDRWLQNTFSIYKTQLETICWSAVAFWRASGNVPWQTNGNRVVALPLCTAPQRLARGLWL